MNDKITSLYNAAWLRVDPTNPQETFTNAFADLLIKECITVLNEGKLGAPVEIGAGLNFGKVLIQEHFGVK